MRRYDLSLPKHRIVGRVLAEQAQHLGGATWLMSGERRLSFGEADETVNRYANGLAALGVKQGEAVAMLMEPSIEVMLVALAAARLGAIFTTLNTDYHGSFLQESLALSNAEVLVVDAALLERLEKLTTLHAVRKVLVNGGASGAHAGSTPLSELLSCPARAPQEVSRWLDPVQVWWSSGTTGKSKGVMHSHSSVLFQTRVHEQDIDADTVMYSCTPVYLGGSWSGTLWPSLVFGVKAAIDPRFSASQFWSRIRYYGATFAFTLGSMHMFVWKQPPTPEDRSHSLRGWQAVPLPSERIPEFKERFGIRSMHQAYGTSETFRVFSLPDAEVSRRGALLGQPVPYLEVALLDEDDQPVPDGQAGEICVRPREPGVMFCGYFSDPQHTVEAWRSLWHHTGDMAMKGPDGLYRFADRKKDYIRYKGRNLSMFEVEAVIEKHPAVHDVTAFGIQSEELESESELMVCVVLKSGETASAEDIARFVNDEAPYFFVPRYIEFVTELPRNAHGRVLKHELRDRGVADHVWDRERAGFKVRRG